jgi:hypothetical protein
MTAGEFDDKFDAGEDVTADLDVSAARRPVQDARDVEAERLWLEEATRRDAELDDGTLSARPWLNFAVKHCHTTREPSHSLDPARTLLARMPRPTRDSGITC